MIVGDMEIRLRADIARLQRDMDSARQVVGNATANIARAADMAKTALGGIGSVAGFSKIAQMSDEYSKLTAQLRLATDSARAYNQAYADVRRISNSSQTDIAATGSLYASLARATKDLGISQSGVADITESVNLALKVSGAGAQESAGAILQLSQAFASGALRGDEFNSVNEASPRLMKAIADSLGQPVGALRSMAEQGKLTADVVAKALPESLQQLRSEASQIQTIAGGFTVLKNNALEFVGTQAQASGVVAVLTSSIGFLAGNLQLLAGAALTAGAAKLGATFATWAKDTYDAVAASVAARAATLANIQATIAETGAKISQLSATQSMIATAREEAVAKLAGSNANIAAARAAISAATAAGAQSFALRAVRLATAELAVAEAQRSAMLAELAMLGRQQTSVSAQLTAALAAQTSAQTALNGATRAGTAAAGVASRALGLLGGPVGAIITILGLAATAWSVWGRSAETSSKQAVETYEEAHKRIVKGLDEQIAKNQKLIQLQNLGMKKPDIDRNQPVLDQLAAASRRLEEINTQTGEFAPGNGKNSYDIFVERQKTMQNIVELTAKMKKGDEVAAKAAAGNTEGLAAIRERLTGVNKQYIADLETLQAKREAGAISEQEYKSLVTQIAVETWKSSAAGKEAEKQSKATASAVKSQAEAYAELMDKIHGKADGQEPDFQKNVALLYKGYQSGKQSLSEYVATMETYIGQQKASIQIEKDRAKAKEEIAKFDQGYSEGLEATSKILEKMVVDAQAEADQNVLAAKTYGMSKAEIERLTVARLEDQLAQRSSLGLTLDEIDTLKKLIEAKKRTVAALSSMEEIEAQKRVWESIEQTAHDTFVSIFDSGKSAFDRLRDTLRNGLMDLLYQMTLKKWLINLETSMTGSGGVTGSILKSIGSMFSFGFPAASAGATAAGAAVAGARANGGPVTGGLSYLVGERGPEIFTPPSNGTVIPNNALGGTAGQAITIQTNLNIEAGGAATSTTTGDQAGYGKALADMMATAAKDAIARESRQGGLIWKMRMGR